ncbi:RDD family protein [Novosphingobium mangrovi (ex Hu et al. 2023)]|uniref:RDD family protein n=1 Tax=Novosphingobium mangrovi (ex Hu et al. 2023) TaxID=2930094 RepID=A0ABT0ADX1_9SPHN|nr:RDD family protein [Novosphingobium mangrovi (ex Hu et al. 2023)]MCJ1961376.1 RDD family protein [Novosphingobium mangrovi (ex Hu et al. 2023)]
MARKERKARKPRKDAPGLGRTLLTPEGISLSIAIASRGARFGALLLDLLFIGLVITGLSVALLFMAGGAASIERTLSSGTTSGYALQFLLVVWLIVLFLFRNAYFLFFELGPRGATPGKRINGLRIAARDGGRLTPEMVIARNLLRDIELFLPIVFVASAGAESGLAWLAATAWFLIFMLFPLFNRDGLRAGDVIAGSWVVQAPRPKLARALSVEAPAEAASTAATSEGPKYRFGEDELAVYGEYELQALERVLRDTRAKAIEPVYHTISEKIGRNDGWGDERAFLEAYYTQLRARLEAGLRMGVRKADKNTEETR